MRTIPAGLFILSLFFTACSSSDKSAEKKDKYEQGKESLEETEKKSPTRFISISGHDKKNLLGQTVIKGTLHNSAKISSYKDIDVELSFYSKTGTLLQKDHEIVYETVEPGSSTNFKTKYFAPKGTDSVAMRVVAAKPGK